VEFGGGVDTEPLEQRLRQVGGFIVQCVIGRRFTGCGWRLGTCLHSRRSGGRRGAPSSFNRWRRRALRGGSVLRPGECEGGGSAWRAQGVGAPRLDPLGGQLLRMQRGKGARGACTPARRCCRGAVTGPALRRGATWSGVGEGVSTHPGPTASAYGRKYAGRVGNAEARRRCDQSARARLTKLQNLPK
jgi:hypothetical protein